MWKVPIHVAYNRKNWKQPKCLLIGEWSNNSGYINTIKYYGAAKNEIYTQSLHIQYHLYYILLNLKTS